MKTQHIPLAIVDNPRLKELLSQADDSNDPLVKGLASELEAEIKFNDETLLIKEAGYMADEIITQIPEPSELYKLRNLTKRIAEGKLLKADMVSLATDIVEGLNEMADEIVGGIEYAYDIKKQYLDHETAQAKKGTRI